jgi:hypothetical protein
MQSGPRWYVLHRSSDGKFEAAGLDMSDFVEIIYPQSMTAKLLENGVVVSEYKIEQCDKCSKLTKFDPFGFQKGYDKNEKVIWFCAGCR